MGVYHTFQRCDPVVCMMKRNESESQNQFRVLFQCQCLMSGVCCVLCRMISPSHQTPHSAVLCVFVHAHLPFAYLNACDVHNEQPELVRHNNTHRRWVEGAEMDSLLGVFFFYHYYLGYQDSQVLDAVAIYIVFINLFT